MRFLPLIGYRKSSQQLALAAEWINTRLNIDHEMKPAFLDRVVTNEATNRKIRVVGFNSKGIVNYDSATGNLPNLSLFANNSLKIGEGSEVKLFRGDENRFWFYLVLKFDEEQYFLLATPRQRISITSMVRDQLLHLVVVAGSAGFFAALLLSIWLSSWMNQPLKNDSPN